MQERKERVDTRLWHDHLPLTVTVGIFAIFVVRLMIASRFDETTALAILEHAEPAAVLFGLALQNGATVIAVLAFHLALERGYRLKREVGSPPWLRRFGPVAAVAVMTALFVSLAGGLLLGASGALLTIDPLHHAHHDHGRWTVVAMPALAIAFNLFLDPRVWLPPKEFSVLTGPVVVGYELDRDEKRVVLLREDDRTVTVLHATEIKHSAYCRLSTTTWWASAVVTTVRRSHYATCSNS
jgi:hypothetical protein